MNKPFDEFMSPLKETQFSLRDFVDFPKVEKNVEAISIKLNQLNYLIGQSDMSAAVERLWSENPKAFDVLDILIAVRGKDAKCVLADDDNVRLISDYFKSPADVTTFLNETGLTTVFQNKQIKNLVDYVFGVEVGLDSNARKNRGGHIMENIIANMFSLNDIPYEREVCYSRYPEIETALGVDNKRFDFVIETREITYLIEANFYSSGGSKLNEVARSYTELAPKINAVKGYEFVWITDGVGWKSARNKLEEAYNHIPNIFNLSDITNFIAKIKAQL